MPKLSTSALALAASLFVAACSGMPASTPMFSQEMLPDAVKVPTGHRVAMESVGVGEITYECRAKAGMAGSFEWVFVGPQAAAMLYTMLGAVFGVLLIAMIGNGFNLLNIDPFYQSIAQGAIILIAVGVDSRTGGLVRQAWARMRLRSSAKKQLANS